MVYAEERVSFFRRLASFLDYTKRIVLVGDWNAIVDPKINRVGRGARGPGMCESTLIDLMAHHDLVDRFRLDRPGREMWMLVDSSPSVHTRSYQDRVLVSRADTDFYKCPTFHCVAQSDNKFVSVSLWDPTMISSLFPFPKLAVICESLSSSSSC